MFFKGFVDRSVSQLQEMGFTTKDVDDVIYMVGVDHLGNKFGQVSCEPLLFSSVDGRHIQCASHRDHGSVGHTFALGHFGL